MQVRILAPFCRTHGSAPGSARTTRPASRTDSHVSCVSVANCSSDGAPAERWICDMRDASSRASTDPEFMLCRDWRCLVRGVPGEPYASLAEAPRQA